MQLVQCKIAIGGQKDTVVVTDPPITYAEYLVMRMIHGDEAVTEACETGTVDVDNDEERKRLLYRFGKDVVNTIFPGAFAKLPERGDMPTLAEAQEVARAAEDAASAARAKQKKKAAAPKVPSVDLSGLPSDVSGAKE